MNRVGSFTLWAVRVAAVVAALCLGACGDDLTNGSTDLAVPGDLSSTPVDQSATDGAPGG